MRAQSWWLLGLLGVVVYFFGEKAVTNIVSGVRGIRNNNPGNIERTSTAWVGMSTQQTDDRFIVFTSPEYGIRAIARILRNYESRGLNTIRKIISTWAPPNENDTEKYIKDVVAWTGINADTPINVMTTASRIIPAIIRKEIGQQPYSAAIISRGIALEQSA